MQRNGTAAEVFRVFLQLGLTSFGGPIAHLGYFRAELVERRRWIGESDYADLVALCQFLPGPASSQAGFALGLSRAGLAGGIAAFVAFTLPSAIFMAAVAYGADMFGGPAGDKLISGLKIVAVAIVGQAVWGMARNLCPDRERATIALAATLLLVVMGGVFGQVTAIALGAVAGLIWCRRETASTPGRLTFQVSRRAGLGSLALFLLLLAGLPLLASGSGSQALAMFDAFYRSGALVFGGGHVVLPLLEAETVQTGLISADAFLAGYGMAQAVPGPLFTFAAYLGAVSGNPGAGTADAAGVNLAGAGIALVAIFLPAALLVVGTLPFWDRIRRAPTARRVLAGVNAGVVGILAAALYTPVFTAGITGPLTLALAAVAFVALHVWKTPAWAVVIVAAAAGWVLL